MSGWYKEVIRAKAKQQGGGHAWSLDHWEGDYCCSCRHKHESSP